MKNRTLSVLLVISLALNVLLLYSIYSNNSRRQTACRNNFNTEIGFAARRRRDYGDSGEMASYYAAVAHVYARTKIYYNIRDYDYVYRDELWELYNVMSLLPQYSSEDPRGLVSVLQGLRADRRQADRAALTRFTDKIRAAERNAGG